MAYSQGDMNQMAEHAAKELRAQLEAVMKDRDTLQRSLNAVSAAIADAGSVVVPNEEERYSDAVRQIIVQRDEWRKKWEDLEVHRASCCDRMEQERDTACAAVLEFEGKLAESARIAEGWRALAETLKQTRNKAWSILTGWDPVRLSNNSHVDADDPNEALIVSAGRTKDYLTRCIAERSELEEKLALRTTERDDWKRACHNREDDLRSARAQRLRRQLEATLDAGRELVESRRERDEAVSQRDMMSDAEDAANDKLEAMTARAEKAERERDSAWDAHRILAEQLDERDAERDAAMKVVEAARKFDKNFQDWNPVRTALDEFDARKNSGSGESPASALGCNRANAPEAGDYDALVKALRETAEKAEHRGFWSSPGAFRLLADELEGKDHEKGGGDGGLRG